MSTRPTRRTMLKTAGLAALAMPARRVSSVEAAAGPRGDLPKICLAAGLGAVGIRQLGVEHVISGGGRIPWEEGRLKEMMDGLKSNGLTLANLMISGFPNAI